MTLEEFLQIAKSFDPKAELLFSNDTSDFIDLSNGGRALGPVVEVNTGTKKYIVFSE